MALIHYWIMSMRGGEKVLEALCRMFPQADIFMHVYDPSALSETLAAHRIRTTSIARLPFAKRLYQAYLPLMPRALEALDLSGYDLVISNEAGPAKGVIAPVGAPHLCCCLSPMRYIWDQYHVYKAGAGPAARAAMPIFAHGLRQWDVTSAARVDRFVAISQHVAARINKYWRRDSDIVHPPVFVDSFSPIAASERQGYYLWLGELVSYKRPDLAIDAFNRLGLPLVVIGGPDAARRSLEARAGDNIKFLGRASFETIKRCLAECKALVFPGEEDFGIVPVEAMASGRPVIAYGRGGILDTVIDGETGVLFDDQSVEGLVAAIELFERSGLADADPAPLVAQAWKFSEPNFAAGISRSLAAIGFDSSTIQRVHQEKQ